jgi:ribosomal protein S18 acetylase RimI-like enzyme
MTVRNVLASDRSIVKHGNKTIGVIFWKMVEEKHHGLAGIKDLWIDENQSRRRGPGEKILRVTVEDMERFFSSDGFALRKITVTTGEDNEPARRLYERVDFQKSAVLKDIFAQDENELVYVFTVIP